MAESGKKVEVRFGTFSCSIEGYDDPVAQMREVLLLMQRMVSETPALVDHGGEFGEAEMAQIEHALDRRDETGDEPPGVVVIRAGAAGADRRAPEDAVTTAEIPPEPPRPDPATPAPDTAAAGVAPVPPEGAGDPGGERPGEPEPERPLDDETAPGPTAAAIFSAPAAAVAEAAFSADIAGLENGEAPQTAAAPARNDADDADAAGPAEQAAPPDEAGSAAEDADAPGPRRDATTGDRSQADEANHLWDAAADGRAPAEPGARSDDAADDADAPGPGRDATAGDRSQADEANHLWDAAADGRAPAEPPPGADPAAGTPAAADAAGDDAAGDDIRAADATAESRDRPDAAAAGTNVAAEAADRLWSAEAGAGEAHDPSGELGERDDPAPGEAPSDEVAPAGRVDFSAIAFEAGGQVRPTDTTPEGATADWSDPVGGEAGPASPEGMTGAAAGEPLIGPADVGPAALTADDGSGAGEAGPGRDADADADAAATLWQAPDAGRTAEAVADAARAGGAAGSTAGHAPAPGPRTTADATPPPPARPASPAVNIFAPPAAAASGRSGRTGNLFARRGASAAAPAAAANIFAPPAAAPAAWAGPAAEEAAEAPPAAQQPPADLRPSGPHGTAEPGDPRARFSATGRAAPDLSAGAPAQRPESRVNIFGAPRPGTSAGTGAAPDAPVTLRAGRDDQATAPGRPVPADDRPRREEAEAARPDLWTVPEPDGAGRAPTGPADAPAGEESPAPGIPAGGRLPDQPVNRFGAPGPASPPAPVREPGPAAAGPQPPGADDRPATPGDTAEQPPGGATGPEDRGRFSALLARLGGRRAAAPEPAPPAEAGPPPPVSGDPGDASPSDLAERAGARTVPELLAVAAAWLTLVEGRPRFTRREVMEIFERLPGTHPRTLEARIKGFGQLVRSSTLILVDDGVFAMAQSELDRFQAMIDGN